MCQRVHLIAHVTSDCFASQELKAKLVTETSALSDRGGPGPTVNESAERATRTMGIVSSHPMALDESIIGLG